MFYTIEIDNLGHMKMETILGKLFVCSIASIAVVELTMIGTGNIWFSVLLGSMAYLFIGVYGILYDYLKRMELMFFGERGNVCDM